MGRLMNPGTKTARGKKNVLKRILELCSEQGVDPNATLSEADVRKFMGMTHAEKNMINLIATGYPVRNAQTVIRAIELKLERNPVTKRTQPSAAESAAVTITVKTLDGDRQLPSTLSAALPSEVTDSIDDEEPN